MPVKPPHPAYRLGLVVGWMLRRWPIWGRAAVALWLIAQLAPTAARIPIEGPFTVQTAHPILCMHTRLVDEVEDLKIYRTLSLAREMGATAIVELFPWAYIQPAEDVYDWHHPDRIIRMARHQGLRVIARLGIVPAWARPKREQTTLNDLRPERYADYARFVAAFAKRYRGVVSQIIPWNEPNLYFEWGFRPVPPEEYVEFLRQIAAAVRAVNPDVQILGGALAPTLEPESSPYAMNDVIYLRRVYAAGGGRYFDGLAVHTYGFTRPPDDPPALDRLNFRRYELLQEVMREYGDGAKPVYITESSWNDHPRWANAVRPGQRVQYTLAALQWAESRWPTVENLCFWYLRAATLYRNYMDNFAFVTVEFRPLPIYEEVRAWARRE
jgi:hypothetical protein